MPLPKCPHERVVKILYTFWLPSRSTLAQVAPTPGGIGAAEAALIAGLTAFGLDAGTAVPAVFLFRIGTFWAPILPGYLAYKRLERVGAL